MPNHVYTTIEFANADDAAKVWNENKHIVKDYGDNEVEAFDFNALIPMPESLDVSNGSVTDDALAYALYSTDPDMADAKKIIKEKCSAHDLRWTDRSWERIMENGLDDEEKDKLATLAKAYAHNIDAYGHMTWYSWANENWNTKWNAYEAQLNGKYISFATAWCAPTPIFEALIAKYPDIWMNIYWYEEQGIENVGDIVSDGKGSVWFYQGSRDEVAAKVYAKCNDGETVYFDEEGECVYTEYEIEDDPEYFEEELGIDVDELVVVEVPKSIAPVYGTHYEIKEFGKGGQVF